jgi:putative hydrolase of the HAD superfamily
VADDRVVLWDFDGTLAERDGRWSACLVDALDDELPGHGIDRETVRPHLHDGFPWHRPDVAHPELADPDAWWAHVGGLIERVCVTLGVDDTAAPAVARRLRAVYADHTRSWSLFEDTVPALEALRRAGWRQVILSNHVPELPALVEGLGLGLYFDAVVNSAVTGYEKPHPEAFAHARRAARDPTELWMVGDNPVADVAGAQAAGIPAILVRRDGAPGLDAVVSRLAAPVR